MEKVYLIRISNSLSHEGSYDVYGVYCEESKANSDALYLNWAAPWSVWTRCYTYYIEEMELL